LDTAIDPALASATKSPDESASAAAIPRTVDLIMDAP
jgi:hypothetical protein